MFKKKDIPNLKELKHVQYVKNYIKPIMCKTQKLTILDIKQKRRNFLKTKLNVNSMNY